ncbi:MAG: abortive infection family protein [Polyangiaceae bacterium]
MYSLLVTAENGAWDKPHYVYDLTRYLEYTDDKLRARLKRLDEAALTELKILPALFAYETPVDSAARVGRITAIHKNVREVRVSLALDPSIAPIEPEVIEALVWELEISGWEMSRTHWAVKEADLFGALNGPTRAALDAPLHGTRAATELDTLVQLAPTSGLDAVARAVRNAIERNEPAEGLDRMHTFATKVLRVVCGQRGIATPKDKPLHALLGEYIKDLRAGGQIESGMTERILKTSISVMESFNDVRNNHSLAHDNVLLNHNEALLIFNHVVDALRFVQELETQLRRAKAQSTHG